MRHSVWHEYLDDDEPNRKRFFFFSLKVIWCAQCIGRADVDSLSRNSALFTTIIVLVLVVIAHFSRSSRKNDTAIETATHLLCAHCIDWSDRQCHNHIRLLPTTSAFASLILLSHLFGHNRSGLHPDSHRCSSRWLGYSHHDGSNLCANGLSQSHRLVSLVEFHTGLHHSSADRCSVSDQSHDIPETTHQSNPHHRSADLCVFILFVRVYRHHDQLSFEFDEHRHLWRGSRQAVTFAFPRTGHLVYISHSLLSDYVDEFNHRLQTTNKTNLFRQTASSKCHSCDDVTVR